MKDKRICLISRKFSEKEGSGEWIYALKLRDSLKKSGFKVFSIEEKNAGLNPSRFKKFFHDWINIPINCLYFYFLGVRKFHFISENQGMCIPILNFIGADTIVTFHDLMRISGEEESLDKKYFRLVYKLASKANKIHCNSQETKDDLKRFLGKKRNTLVIPVNCRKFFPRKKKKISGKLGYLGTFISRKRPEKFLKIGKRFLKDNLKWNIDLWGKGELFEFIKINKNKMISLKGFAPEKKLNRIYNSFDFFVFPTEYEGLGMPIIEAAMCGIPIFIYSDAKISPEVKDICIVCSGEEDLFKKIKSLRTNTKEYFELRKKIISKSKQFSFKENTKKLISFYNS